MRSDEVMEVLENEEMWKDYDENVLKDITRESFYYTNDDGETHLAIICEELAELFQVIVKKIRLKGNRYSAIEEIADVFNSYYYLNEKFHWDIDLSIKRSILEVDSEYEILQYLNKMQSKVLEFLETGSEDGLYDASCDVLHILENLKAWFSIADEEVRKVSWFKMLRLKNRMDGDMLV